MSVENLPAGRASSRPAVPLALAALTGVVLGGVVPLGPIVPAAVASVAALLALARRSLAFLLVAVVALGLARRLDAREGAATVVQEDAFALLRGRVASEPSPKQGGAVELLFQVERGSFLNEEWGSPDEPVHGPGDPFPAGAFVRAHVDRAQRKRAGDLLPGRRLDLAGTLRAPLEPKRPDGFDLARDLRREGACGVFVVAESWRLDGSTVGPSGVLARLGRRARWAIRDAHLPRDEEAIVRALVLGDRNGLSPSLHEAFKATAMVHAITVSGLHVAVLAWTLGALVRFLPVKARGFAVALGLALYLGLAGPHPGVLRAAIAGTLLALAQGWGRGGDGWNRLAVAVLAVLAYDPESVEEAGFQLTFGTVAGILALAPVFRRALGRGRFRGELATSLAGFVAHAPIVVARFGQVAPVSILANLPALPLTTAALVLGLLGTGLGLVHHSLGYPFLVLAGLAARALLALVELAAHLPPLQLPRPSPIATVLAVGLAALGFHGGRRWLLATGVLLWIASVLPGPRAPGPATVSVLPGETVVTGPVEQLSESVYRVESQGESVLVLDDAGGKELAHVMATVPEGKLRASVVVIRGRTSVALEKLVSRTRPLLVIAATKPAKRLFPSALEGAWTVVLGATLGVERYDASR